jgi:photosystem II stability/assembly factor-like uncharacterized protein
MKHPILLSVMVVWSLAVGGEMPDANGASTTTAGAVYQGDWIADGPVGGTVSALLLHPGDARLFLAGTDDGTLYQSVNSGQSWRRLQPGLNHRGVKITCLVFYPANPDILYAGVAKVWKAGGLYRSLDRGETWTAVADLAGVSVHQVCYDPSNPAVVYAATENGVYKSVDGGSSWTHKSRGLQHVFVKSVAVHPHRPEVLYAGTWRQVYKSTDGGEQWTLIPTGMDTDTDIFALVLDPQRPATVYAATCNGIFKTVNGGAQWTKFAKQQGLTAIRVQTLIASRHAPQTLYAGTTDGIFRTRDAGRHWQRLTPPAISVLALGEDRLTPQRLYAGVEGGAILHTDDGGQTWRQRARGLVNTHVRALVLDPGDPTRLYAGTLYGGRFGGVFCSSDGGVTWQQRSTGLTDTDVEALAIHPHNAQILYAGTHAGLFMTTNGGKKWERIGQKTFDGIRITTICCSASDPGRVYVGAWQGIFSSHDGGATWQTRWTGRHETAAGAANWSRVYTLCFDPRDERVLYAGTDQGILMSRDAGASWAAMTPFFTRVPVQRVVIHPANPQIVFAGTSAGVFRTENAGKAWRKLVTAHGNLSVGALTLDWAQPNRLYLGGLRHSGFYMSQNRGTTWRRLDQAIAYNHIWAAALDYSYPGKLYVGTSGSGVYRYLPKGRFSL